MSNAEMIKNRWLAVSILMAVLLVSTASVSYTGSDPRGTLLLSEAMVSVGTTKLDHYGPEVIDLYGYAIHEKKGHFYYYFPVGTSLISAPLIAIANGFGVSMVDHEASFQRVLAAATAVLTLLYLARLAGLFLNPANAVLIAATFWFGSSWASSAGTALWSHNFATLFALMAIYYCLQSALSMRGKGWHLIGTCLFLAYLCRPTMALLAPFTLLFFLSYHWKAAFKSGIVLSFWLALFIGYSYWEFGQFLPDYYLPKRLSGGDFTEALLGNLISPARGLLIYSPFIAVAWLCFAQRSDRFNLKNTWLLIALAWPIAHLVIISRFPHWWAGHSYGARFMTDVLPGLFLLTLKTWPVTPAGRRGVFTVSLLAITICFSIYINSWQGLFNKYTARWNTDPNVDSFPFLLFDWQYPQFLHNESNHQARLARHEKLMDMKNPVVEISHLQSPEVSFEGWSEPEETHRWNDGHSAVIRFTLTDSTAIEGVILVEAGYNGTQQIVVKLNDTLLERYSTSQLRYPKRIEFDPSLLSRHQVSQLQFEFPDAAMPGNGDQRKLALALRKISIK